MAHALDVADAIASALTEVGVNGRLDVRMGGSRSTLWVGMPTGDDYEIVVTVTPLARHETQDVGAARP